MLRLVTAFLLVGCVLAGRAEAQYASRPPIRPLPRPSQRPRAPGPAVFVDAARGNDMNDGSEATPWKTLGSAIPRLRPGQTLYLRGGIHWAYGQVAIGGASSGTAAAPVTIRGFPGELAIVDFGFREFHDTPAAAWEPFPGGAPGEYRSTAVYPNLKKELCGNFADSMVPFFRYRFMEDLRSRNEFWNAGLENRAQDPNGIYAGPGVFWDATSQRIHIRLQPTTVAALGDDNYRGESDPRKLELVICRSDDPARFRIVKASHVRVQDLVLRGSDRTVMAVTDSDDVELDGLWIYNGLNPLVVSDSRGVRILNTRVRGFDAPWHSRKHDKDRSAAGYLGVITGTDVEVAYSEFTDNHDGLALDGVDGLRFHHNLVSNLNDDGLGLPPKRPNTDLRFYQNTISGCLECLTFHTIGEPGVVAAPGSGLYVYRNVFDLRRLSYGSPPTAADPTHVELSPSALVADHESPVWAVTYFYQNTVISQDGGTSRGAYGFGLGGHTQGTTRRVFNNVFVQVVGAPGQVMPPAGDDFMAAGNLFWGVAAGVGGNHAGDVHADPRFAAFTTSWRAPVDFRLQQGSPAINAGVAVPAEWPDPLRASDEGAPDIGALPYALVVDAGAAAGDGGGEPPATAGGTGCGCRVTGSSRGRPALLLVVLVALRPWRRRS
jgi:MYXO-CTERM domain-containing protein